MRIIERLDVKNPYKEDYELHNHKFYVMLTSSDFENLEHLSRKWNLKNSAALRRCIRIAFEKEFL